MYCMVSWGKKLSQDLRHLSFVKNTDDICQIYIYKLLNIPEVGQKIIFTILAAVESRE